MKATGIVRKVDNLGRLVIPSELRETYGIDPESPVEIYTEEDRIVLKKYEPSIPGELTVDDLKNMDGKPVFMKFNGGTEWAIYDRIAHTLSTKNAYYNIEEVVSKAKFYAKEW